MTNPRLAPELSLRLGGSPAPAELRASLTAVRLETSFGAADRVELTLANEKLRWLDHPLLKVDGELVLALGYAPDPLEQLFVGEIVGQSATFPGSGTPTLTVSAQDRRVRMQQGTKRRSFAIPVTKTTNAPLPDLAVASLVAGESMLVPEFDPVGAALSVILGGASAIASVAGGTNALQEAVRSQDRESDFDFLTRICAENGWEMLVDHADPLGGRKLRFFSPLGHLTPDVELAWGRSLLEFAPKVTKVGQVASITAYVWVSRIKRSFAVTVGWDWDRMQLTLDVQPAGSTPKGDSDVVLKKPLSPLAAPREIVSRLVPKLNSRLTGSGSAVGDPRIRPGAVVKLEGLGEQFGGLYRVTGATHSLDTGGYRTGFQVRKEIWFGSIPLPDQGAVPIRVGA